VSSDGCSLLCSVDKETTLLWFKDEQILNRSSSASSLPLTVNTEDLSSSYRCVAANPAGNKTLLVNINASCSEDATTWILSNKGQRHRKFNFNTDSDKHLIFYLNTVPVGSHDFVFIDRLLDHWTSNLHRVDCINCSDCLLD